MLIIYNKQVTIMINILWQER